MAMRYRLHAHPERGWAEAQASPWLSERVTDARDTVDKGLCDFPTACVARAGSGPRHLALCAAYDSCNRVSCFSPFETRAQLSSRGPPVAEIPCHGGRLCDRVVHAASASATERPCLVHNPVYATATVEDMEGKWPRPCPSASRSLPALLTFDQTPARFTAGGDASGVRDA